MHYWKVKRLQKLIAFLRMIISHFDREKNVEGKFRVISSQSDVFQHLFYENNRIDPMLTLAFDVDKLGHVIHAIEVCAQPTGYVNEEIHSRRAYISTLNLRICLQLIVDSLESYIRGGGFRIFYAWQSDISNKSNRNFIENSLDAAIINVNSLLDLPLFKDKDTKGETGSPDISEVIFNKINRSMAFVADISFVNEKEEGTKFKGLPNANVMIEYGYAVAVLGEENIITVFNRATGNVDDIPFDIKQNRMMFYNYDQSMGECVKKQEKENLINDLSKAIEGICRNRLGM